MTGNFESKTQGNTNESEFWPQIYTHYRCSSGENSPQGRPLGRLEEVALTGAGKSARNFGLGMGVGLQAKVLFDSDDALEQVVDFFCVAGDVADFLL